MRRHTHSARSVASNASFPLDTNSSGRDDAAWFVYLFALSDCTAFKVGFSCNPLQRICTFSRRYFERFDLSQSVLLNVTDCDVARALEAKLKGELASVRTEAPVWVSKDAGGHTEWFSAVYFSDAEACLRASRARTQATSAFELFRGDLEHYTRHFELWARSAIEREAEVRSLAERGYHVADKSGALRDWLDAYRYFDLPLFAAEPELSEWMRRSVLALHCE